jgi:diacylglycerol kinase family enzyme
MPRTVPVLINRSGGTAASRGDALRGEVEAAFAQTGRTIHLELLDGRDMADAVSRHADQPLVIVGGGDGTLSAAAAVLAGRRTALGILPLGTRNHLARQLGLPLDLPGAAAVAVGGQRRRIDLGSAGARVFVNNASFGIYTRFVRTRDTMRGPKWLDTLPATIHVLKRMKAQQFPLRINGLAKTLATPLLFIGNNEYAIDGRHLGERASLTDGELSVYAVAAQRPWSLLAFAARAIVGLARPERDFKLYASAREIVIDGEGAIEGAFDGELEMLQLPLVIRTLPGALGVVTPREPATVRELTRDSLIDRTT